MNQLDLARECGVHEDTISRWETGKTIPDPHRFKTLSTVLGCSIHYLRGNEEELDGGSRRHDQ